MRARAEGGDAGAMCDLGYWYANGERGLEKDDAASYGWFKRGADLGHATCLSLAGICLSDGAGVEKNL
eukprot:7325467-Prymnesium_polylepis.1